MIPNLEKHDSCCLPHKGICATTIQDLGLGQRSRFSATWEFDKADETCWE